jgi:hypothetical protein
MAVALITIHGMGTTKENYNEALLKKLKNDMGDLFKSVHIGKVYYQELLQANQRLVWERVEAGKKKVHYDDLRKFTLYGLGDAVGLETRKSDDGSVYELAQLEIAKTLYAAYQKLGSGGKVIFLTQSLGCQVLSNYLYDAQQAKKNNPVAAGIWKTNGSGLQAVDPDHPLTAEAIAFLSGDTCMGWISTGCNIPVFVAAHKNMAIRAIDPPSAQFKWINLYDPDDILGWPLQPLLGGYETLVEDRQINAGQGLINWILKSWNPVSHTSYWTDDDVVLPLTKMLTQLIH